ncbi:MAG: DUF4157 domain-containing protein [Gaiellaceae bacterium]
MSGERTHSAPQKSEARPVTKPGDRHEREAERAGDVVARGGTVAGWSFTKVPATPVQRQEVVKEKSDEEKKKEALTKAGEAALETPQAKAVKDKVLADPLVKTVKNAVTSTPGLIATGAVAAGGVAALGAAKKPLPFQPPAIPLDKITPGLSAQVKYEGPVNSPTFVGLSLTYKEQGPKGKPSSKSDDIAKETAALKAQQELFRPTGQKAAEKAEDDAAVQAYIRSQKFTIPLTPGAPAKKDDAPKPDEGQKKEEDKPVQRAPASATAAQPVRANVDGGLATAGRPLEPGARRSMEARFGRDFSSVRVHDDARAAATAASIDAAAFTVGEDLVFAPGRYDPSSDEGRRLLAHELTHVVQQDDRQPLPGGTGRPLDRKLRAYFEPRLGVDLSRVRTHTDAGAAESAKRLRARAYTVGSDVVFGPNQYEPETQRGRWLVAHELAHVAQAGRASGAAGTRAVERDANAAATAAVTGKPVRIGARRSGVELHKFGEPDDTPDLTFVSTSGKPGFLAQATQFHQTWGLSPQRFNSMQGLVATLAAGTGTIGRLRIVSHADFDNIFTPLFDGGSPGITEEDLLTWGESDPAGLRHAMGPLVKRTHPLWSSTITGAQGANPAIFTTFGIDPANPPTTGPVAQLLDAAVDLVTIRGATGGLPASQRTTFDTALTQQLDGLRTQVVQQLPTGSTTTAADVQALQDSITNLISVATIPRQDAKLMASIAAASSAVASGFRANLTAVRARINGSTWIDIRGCRVGQKPTYLAAVATFFGSGTTKPHVSGPEWWQSFPRLGWHTVSDAQMTRRAAEPNVSSALGHWADVTGIRDRLRWWRMFLMRVLIEEGQRSLEELKAQARPPALFGGLRLTIDPLLVDFTTDLPPLPKLQQPDVGAGIGFQPPGPKLPAGPRLQNPLVPVAQRDLKRYDGTVGLFRYYLDAGLPLPVQEGANVELMSLLFKLGREKDAIDAWTASEWGAGAPGLAAVQSGAWDRDAIRQVEAVVNLDSRRRALAMYISPDPRYAEHIKKTA